ncbi:MAG: hypothetical protein BWY68_00546 [bacterium ADurb.Bin400]|nr:MAG: hypothetical protein BWY68_00546 [bacterium ADurb.Bin400]
MKKTISKYSYLIALIVVLLSFAFFLITHYLIVMIDPSISLTMAIFFLSSVLLSAIATTGMLVLNPVLTEAVFISRRMHRFESLSNPLLVKLSTEAPGTYHHSMNVSNLAQKAAKSINADSLLVRTAAYYHDIGKLANPRFYVENQSSLEIPLDDPAAIQENVQAIISHVKEGVAIAQKHGIPEGVIDLIAQHHGTTKVVYFYEKAKEQGIKVKHTDFRYPGPKPLSKEAAILMLSDSVEAAARALPDLSDNNIKALVEKTVKERTSDNQLKNAHFTDKEIATITESLTNSLISIHHQRIQYKKNGKR